MLTWPQFNPGQLALVAAPLASLSVVLVAEQLLVHGGNLVAALWLEPHDVALVASAQRGARCMALLLMASNAVLSPRFAKAALAKDAEGLKRLLYASMTALSACALPVAVLLCVFSTQVMELFGDGYGRGAFAFSCFVIGQAVNAMTGSVSQILVMAGQESIVAMIVSIAALAVLIALVLLGPKYGINAIAMVLAAGMALQNLVTFYFARKYIGSIDVS